MRRSTCRRYSAAAAWTVSSANSPISSGDGNLYRADQNGKDSNLCWLRRGARDAVLRIGRRARSVSSAFHQNSRGVLGIRRNCWVLVGTLMTQKKRPYTADSVANPLKLQGVVYLSGEDQLPRDGGSALGGTVTQIRISTVSVLPLALCTVSPPATPCNKPHRNSRTSAGG